MDFRLLTIYKNKNKLKPKNCPQIVLSENTLINCTSQIDENEPTTKIHIKWLEKKYEFLYEDFKDTEKHPFFFSYWLAVFNATYIFLITECSSVAVLFDHNLGLSISHISRHDQAIPEKSACPSAHLQLFMHFERSIPQFGAGYHTKPSS